MGEANCFDCTGIARQECVNSRRYVPHGDYYDCIYSAIAKEDLKKLERRELGNLQLDKTMLATYLTNIGDKKALEILAKD